MFYLVLDSVGQGSPNLNNGPVYSPLDYRAPLEVLLLWPLEVENVLESVGVNSASLALGRGIVRHRWCLWENSGNSLLRLGLIKFM